MNNNSFQIVVETVRDLARDKQIPKRLVDAKLFPSTLLEDLGMDSLGQLNLLSELEERIDATFSETAISGIDTRDDLAEIVAQSGKINE
jgi:acyl carrier protein